MRSRESYEEVRRRLAEDRYGGVCECGNHAWCRLTRGYVALVSPEDADTIKTKAYHAKETANGIYASRGVRVEGKMLNINLHREVLGTTRDCPITDANDRTDFKNGNALDCRQENLQPCTQSQVLQHLRKSRSSETYSRYKGVRFLSMNNGRQTHWSAQVGHNGKSNFLGLFPLTSEGEEAAARAYDEAARKLFGEFACVNFPEPGERHALRKAA
jgi:hypothetical protein